MHRAVVIAFTLGVVCVATDADALADEKDAVVPDTSVLMTNRELYEDCKQAIAYAENNDIAAFLRSHCAGIIQGTILGYGIAVDLKLKPGVTGASHYEARKQLANELKADFCPGGIDLRSAGTVSANDPIRVESDIVVTVARDFVERIEHLKRDSPTKDISTLLSSRNFLSVFLATSYKCDLTQ